MTPQERQQLLALDYCHFGKRAFDKRFTRDLAGQIRRGVTRQLSREQRYTLAKLVHRYRRQLARRLPAELILQQPPVKSDYGLVDHPETVADLFTVQPSPPKEAHHHE